MEILGVPILGMKATSLYVFNLPLICFQDVQCNVYLQFCAELLSVESSMTFHAAIFLLCNYNMH